MESCAKRCSPDSRSQSPIREIEKRFQYFAAKCMHMHTKEYWVGKNIYICIYIGIYVLQTKSPTVETKCIKSKNFVIFLDAVWKRDLSQTNNYTWYMQRHNYVTSTLLLSACDIVTLRDFYLTISINYL